MSLRDLDIKIEYRTMVDNIVKDFYNPLLSEAVHYKRAVGFFSSSVLMEISRGISGLINNGGSIQMIASPRLSEDDISAIKLGYKTREEIVHEALKRELKGPVNSFQSRQLNYLANLIADGFLDIKIAITESASKIGMYHEKVGIIEDSFGNKVAFSGSMNETANALIANYETVDVFMNWNDTDGRVNAKERAFDAIWQNAGTGIRIIEIGELNNEIITKYKYEKVDYCVKETELEYEVEELETSTFFRQPPDLSLYDYQKDAITKWMEKSCCGVFDMATGTGKTITGLSAVTTLSRALNERVSVIIVAPYRHLVEQWVEDIENFGVKPIIAYSYPGQKWRSEFTDSINAYNCGAENNFCIITTNATFSGEDFQNLLQKYRKDFCIVVDEAHNFGAEKLSKLLPKKARYRLALSATIERYRDVEGTEALQKYFGKEPCILFDLKSAIKRGFLTPYYYHPILVYLNECELEQYNEISRKIVRLSGIKHSKEESNKQLDILFIQRARIVAGCSSKVSALIDAIEPYKHDHNILVYCGATKYDNEDLDDDEDIRQIDEVTHQLHSALNMKVRKFTSEEGITERAEIKDMFIKQELQVITAIKCLDEGVNIPAIEKAFILASSTNPKEYIQRRGRVLRKYPGKEYAHIFDFITLPRPLCDVKYLSGEERKNDLSLVRREFNRMVDFANTAQNPSGIEEMKQKIETCYSIKDLIVEDDIL